MSRFTVRRRGDEHGLVRLVSPLNRSRRSRTRQRGNDSDHKTDEPSLTLGSHSMNLLTRFKEATGTAWRAVVDLFEPGRAAFSDVFTKELELISRRRAAPSSEGKSVGHNGGLPDFHEPSDILRNVLQALKASEEA